MKAPPSCSQLCMGPATGERPQPPTALLLVWGSKVGGQGGHSALLSGQLRAQSSLSLHSSS